ncbi:hypothetical protein ACLOJK_004762 [Asimina triloba]
MSSPWGTAPTTLDQQPINDQSFFRPDLASDGHLEPTHQSNNIFQQGAGIGQRAPSAVLDEQQIDCSAPTPSRPNFGSKIGRKSQRGVAHPSKSSCPPMAIKETHPDINDHQKVQQASKQIRGRR